ncbi:MAG: ribosome maturation factor RimM [Anaerolineae bacterium]|nr:ribosome maturation factor RimM [Anaerolineae bacterium]
MRILTDYPERLSQTKHVYTSPDQAGERVTSHQIKSVRLTSDHALITLESVPDRNAAEFMRGLYVLIDLADAVPLEDDEIYLFQLIGMSVEMESGEVLGPITDVLETGANDVYVVQSERYGEVLIPVTEHTILETNTDENRIIVRLPEGLLPE